MTAEYSEYQGSEEIYSNKAETMLMDYVAQIGNRPYQGRVKYNRGYIKTGDIGLLAASHSWLRT